MVFFTCNHCGSSLRKPKVDMHRQWTCLKPISVFCHDCLKDFGEGDYQAHIKCITDEKYYAKYFISKQSSEKGERKQQARLEFVRQIQQTEKNLTKEESNLLDTITHHQNIPKKWPQFKNFICNIFHDKISQRTIDRVWNLLEERKNKMNPAENESESKQNAGKENEDMLSTKEPLKDGEVEESEGKSEKKGNYWLRNRYEAELKDIKNQQLGVLEELGDCKQQRKEKKESANVALNEEGNVDGSAYGEESNVVKEKKLRKSEIQDSTTERQTVHVSKRRDKKRQLNNDAEYGMEGNVGKKKAFQKYKVKNSGTEEEETVEVSKKRGRKSQLNYGDNAESAKERQDGHAVRAKKSLKDNVRLHRYATRSKTAVYRNSLTVSNEREVVENNVLQKSEVEDCTTERDKVLDPKKTGREGDAGSASTSSEKTQDESNTEREAERRKCSLLRYYLSKGIYVVFRKIGG